MSTSEPTPTDSGRPLRLADFPTILHALEYAAEGRSGLNFYSPKGALDLALSYRELRDAALAFAGRLRAAGLRPGERVALAAETDAAFVTAFFGCQYAGVVPAPLPLPAAFGGKEAYLDQVRGMANRAGARAMFGPPDLAAFLSEAGATLGIRLAGGYEVLPEAPPLATEERSPSALAYVQFSSGSTRFPKAVAVTHQALMANALAVAQHGLKVRPDDRAASWLPLYHDMGLVGFLLTPVGCQMSIDLLPTRAFARRPLLWLEIISQNGGTLAYSPSFGYALCARRAETASPAGLDLSRWRVAGIGGDMIRPQVLETFAERFAAVGFRQEAYVASYGMAEATLALCMAPLGRGLRTDAADVERLERDGEAGPGPGRLRSFVLNGPALPKHAVQVRGEDGDVLPERRVGRIFASGPSLLREYLDDPAATAEVLHTDGWLDTGDLGYLLDGELVVTGRVKDLIIVNGRNIAPQDLEWSAEAESGSLRSGDACAFSVDDGDLERIIILVQARSRDMEARDALRADLTAHLRSRHGVETEVVLVPPHSLPLTSSGKLSRSRAKRMFIEGSFRPMHASAD